MKRTRFLSIQRPSPRLSLQIAQALFNQFTLYAQDLLRLRFESLSQVEQAFGSSPILLVPALIEGAPAVRLLRQKEGILVGIGLPITCEGSELDMLAPVTIEGETGQAKQALVIASLGVLKESMMIEAEQRMKAQLHRKIDTVASDTVVERRDSTSPVVASQRSTKRD